MKYFIIGVLLFILILIYFIPLKSKSYESYESYEPYKRPVFDASATKEIAVLEKEPQKLTSMQLFKLAETYHYGKLNIGIDYDKAIHYYSLSIQGASNANTPMTGPDTIHIGKCFMALGRLYEEGFKNKPPDAIQSIDAYLHALKYGYEEALLKIAKIYFEGLHPFYLPEKLSAGKIYNMIIYDNKFSDTLKTQAKQSNKEVNKLAYADLDRIPEGDREYKPLPYGIVDDVTFIINKQHGRFTVPYNNNNKPKITTIANPDIAERPDRPRIVEIERNIETLDDFQETLWNDVVTRHRNDNILNLIPEQEIYNDSQNVHSSTVNNAALKKINIIEDNTNIDNSFNNNTKEFLYKLEHTNLSNDDKQNAIKLLESLKDLKHSKFDKSETEVFNTVWSRIKDPINNDRANDMVNILAQNMASGIEHNYTVCSTGKIIRMISSLDAIDAGNLPTIKPEWAIKEEMAQVASKIRENTLRDANSSEKIDYEANPESKLSNVMKQTFTDKCKVDYKDILNDTSLNDMIKTYSEHF